MPQTPQECRTCATNGFPKQMIVFEQLPGMFKPDGKPKFKPVNPDNSKHEHKMMTTTIQNQTQEQQSKQLIYPASDLSKETRSPKQFEGVEELPYRTVQETNTIIPSTQLDKEEYFRRKEEKYDKNIEEYKQWQKDSLNEQKYIGVSLDKIVILQEESVAIQKDIRDMISSYLHPNPTIQKASELSNHLGLSEEDRPDTENEDENPERQGEQEGGYPE